MDRVMPVPEALIGMRFDIAVSRMLGVSRSQAAAYIDRGEVSIAGRGSQRSAQKSEKLAQGDSIEVAIAEDRDKPEPVDYGMRIVYEDDDLRMDRPYRPGDAESARRAHHGIRPAGKAGHSITIGCRNQRADAGMQVRAGI